MLCYFHELSHTAKKAKNENLNSPQGDNSLVNNNFFIKFFSLQGQNKVILTSVPKYKIGQVLKILPPYQKRLLTTKDCCEQIKLKLLLKKFPRSVIIYSCGLEATVYDFLDKTKKIEND
jgi:hypothetical protein